MNAKQSAPIAVVGALNLDMCGVPSESLRMRDSTPGYVELRAGGVGHNIARHLALAGQRVELVSMLGNDFSAQILRRHCDADGIGLQYTAEEDMPSSTYLCIHDRQGDMVAAINDMSILDRFTPEHLYSRMPVINSAPLAVVDANLPQETLEALAESATVPLMLDPVSGFKAERVRNVIGRFAIMKPNKLEAELMTGEADPALAAASLLDKGVKMVFISLGEKGVYYADASDAGQLPSTRMHAPNTTGAGDSMSAGIAMGYLRGESIRDCARSGIETVTQHLLRQGGSIL